MVFRRGGADPEESVRRGGRLRRKAVLHVLRRRRSKLEALVERLEMHLCANRRGSTFHPGPCRGEEADEGKLLQFQEYFVSLLPLRQKRRPQFALEFFAKTTLFRRLFIAQQDFIRDCFGRAHSLYSLFASR